MEAPELRSWPAVGCWAVSRMECASDTAPPVDNEEAVDVTACGADGSMWPFLGGEAVHRKSDNRERHRPSQRNAFRSPPPSCTTLVAKSLVPIEEALDLALASESAHEPTTVSVEKLEAAKAALLACLGTSVSVKNDEGLIAPAPPPPPADNPVRHRDNAEQSSLERETRKYMLHLISKTKSKFDVLEIEDAKHIEAIFQNAFDPSFIWLMRFASLWSPTKTSFFETRM